MFKYSRLDKKKDADLVERCYYITVHSVQAKDADLVDRCYYITVHSTQVKDADLVDRAVKAAQIRKGVINSSQTTQAKQQIAAFPCTSSDDD